MLNKKVIWVPVICLSLAANALLGLLLVNQIYANAKANQTHQLDLKTLSFTNLFIQKVLLSDQPVDFNTRLQLETMVRNLNDPDILAQWQAFTQSQDQTTASAQVKKLLYLLVSKIS